MSTAKFSFGEKFNSFIKSLLPGQKLSIHGHYHCRAFDKDGNLKWEDGFDNLVVNVGLNHVLDVILTSGSKISTWYLGLKGNGSVVAADTMSSHAGWSEIVAYSGATRPQWVPGGITSLSISNSGSPASYTINANGTVIYGAFLTSVNTKSGTTGTLFSGGNFTSPKTLDSAEILEITVTYTVSSS